jgi:acyl dehydratase
MSAADYPALEIAAITKEQLVRYAGASGDFNPIHYDADFARQAGYDGPIAHGMLSMAFLGRAVTGWVGEGNVLALSARFKAVTYPGDSITITGTVVQRRGDQLDLALEARKADGSVTTTGKATVRVVG